MGKDCHQPDFNVSAGDPTPVLAVYSLSYLSGPLFGLFSLYFMHLEFWTVSIVSRSEKPFNHSLTVVDFKKHVSSSRGPIVHRHLWRDFLSLLNSWHQRACKWIMEDMWGRAPWFPPMSINRLQKVGSGQLNLFQNHNQLIENIVWLISFWDFICPKDSLLELK